MKAFHRKLHRWYADHGRRDLPWRNTSDPYAIYVSEIMLQQTQVKTVLERFYFPFLKRFPTLLHLAAASQNDALSAWQGLGYYSRALNLHQAAKRIVGGKVSGFRFQDSGKKDRVHLNPESRNLIPNLMSLPGIGRNTAHAIAAFAYRQPVAVMEANVKRVVSRIFALKTPSDAQLWEKATALLDTKEPFDYNQAMMDIGATICKKRAPLCGQCPANAMCQGKSSPESYPAAKTKKTTPVRKKRIAILRNIKGEYYAAPRQTRFLHGLYHFLETEASAKRIALNGHQYAFIGKPIGHVRQQYSHFILEADIWLLDAGVATGKNWFSLPRLKKLPASMAEKKMIELLPKLAAHG